MLVLTCAAEPTTSMTAWRVATLSVTVFVFYSVVIAADDNGTCKTPAPSPSVATEKRLMDCLMKSYNQDVRPAHNVSDVVTVHFDMTYIHIVSLNTKSKTLRSKSWLQKSWVDPQLKWDPQNFGNIDTIRIPAKKIWTPDIVLFNSLDVGGETVVDTLAVVNSNGTVTWTPHEILTSHCPMHMRHFPQDQQTCHLAYGSWTYDNTELKLKLKTQSNPKFLYGDQLEDENWHVSQLTATPHDAQINGGAEFSNVLYTLVISRSSPYYGETLQMPAILFSILTMAMFFIPAATGERLLYGVGLLLVSVFQLRNVEAAVPGDTGQVPLVVVYLAFDQVMLTVGIVLSIVVYNCHYRNVKRGSVPDCLKKVFLGRLSRLLCVPAEPYTRLPLNVDDAELDMTPFPYDTDPPATTDAAPADDKDRALEATLDDIRKYLRICATHATSGGETGSHHQVVLNEWIQLARVIDRLLFAIFLTITFLTLCIAF